jgi:hypothetical protein
MVVRRRLGFALMLVLSLLAGSAGRGPVQHALSNSCLTNPPPNCEFDPVCTLACDAQFPPDKHPDANCECKLGCCRPFE